jgi:hypothetical protein
MRSTSTFSAAILVCSIAERVQDFGDRLGRRDGGNGDSGRKR